MKVLNLVTDARKDNTTYTNCARTWSAICKNLGYEVETVTVQDNSDYITEMDTSEYAFTMMPALRNNVTSGKAYYDVFDLDIPVFVQMADAASPYNALVGADTKVGSTSTGRKVLYPTVGDLYLYGFGYSSLGSTTTVLGTNDADGTMVVWKNEPVGKAPVYCHGGWSDTHTILPILIQEAINDGNIAGTKLPTKKLVTMLDIDDFPDATNTLADLQATYAVQEQYGIPITWGLKTNVTGQPIENDAWNDLDADVKAFVAARTPDKGGLIYPCSHNHNWWWNKGQAPIDTKAAMDTEYRADVARAVADGITMGRTSGGLDSWGYIFPPNNQVSDDMFQLGSPQTTRLSSPGNDTVQAGYGWKAVRIYDTGSAGDGYGMSKETIAARPHRGMTLLSGSYKLGTGDILYTEDSATEIDDFSTVFGKWFTDCMAFRGVHFWHGSNFYDGHSSGNAPALKVLRLMGKWGAFMSDIHEFKHPSEVVDTYPDIVITN